MNQRRCYKYGLSVTDINDILAAQSGRCGGCGCRPRTRLEIDHDHWVEAYLGRRTKETVRGLLCRSCNNTLSSTWDAPVHHKYRPRLAMYLIRYEEKLADAWGWTTAMVSDWKEQQIRKWRHGIGMWLTPSETMAYSTRQMCGFPLWVPYLNI